MIRELLITLSCSISFPGVALAQTGLFPALVDETLGTASRPVRFDWRGQSALPVFSLGQPLELNNFESHRWALSVAFPGTTLVPFLGVAYVGTNATPSSEAIARTPYRQVGRPSRFEIEGGVQMPLAEGVVTVSPSWFPASEALFFAKGTLRYLLYPWALEGKDLGGAVGALFTPTLTRSEKAELRKEAPGSMTIDDARLNLLVGLGAALYSESGFSLEPTVQLGVPFLGSKLGLWWDVALGVGHALP